MQNISRRSFIAAGTAATAATAIASVAVADEAAPAAVQNGTAKAGYLNYFDWLGEAPALTPADAAKVVEADVVVVGGGNAGICVALAATEAGAKVAVVEKQYEESYTFLGHDIGTLNSKHMLDMGAQQIDELEFLRDWTRRNMNRTNPVLVRKFAANSGASLDWILSHLTADIVENAGIFGVPLPTEYPGEISGYKAWSAAIHFQATDDGATDWPDAAKQLVAAACEQGAAWYYGQTAQVLVKDESGRVTGVLAKDDEDVVTLFNASKAVVLSAGDYVANPTMVFGLNDEYRNFVEERGLDWTTIKGNGRTGDGQRMGCWAGGRMEPGPRASMGRAMGAGAFGGVALPQFNCRGKRFMDEGMMGVWGNMFQAYRQPKGEIWGIADANWRAYVQKNAPEHVYPGTGSFHDGGFLLTLDEQIADVIASGDEGFRIRGCLTYAADTLEQLADRIGYSPEVKETFLAEVARYNELCAKGVDEDFGKDSFLMEPIATPPFFASFSLDTTTFRLGLVELGGLMTDGNQQVYGPDDEPIPGLFATGNCCGGRFSCQYHTSIAGISVGWATTMGKLLGEYVATL